MRNALKKYYCCMKLYNTQNVEKKMSRKRRERANELMIELREYEGANNMPYVSSADRYMPGILREEAIKEGECKILQILLEQKFGKLNTHHIEQLKATKKNVLEKMTLLIQNAKRI